MEQGLKSDFSSAKQEAWWHDLFSAKVDEEVPSASSPLISDDFSAHPWTTQATEIGFLKICILNLLLGLITAPAVHL